MAQTTGTIKGVITDATTGEGVIGANVFVETLSIGASTGLDGDFSINKIPAGKYTLRISSIGYASSKLENIEVKPGAETVINTKLDEELTALNEVVVTAVRETSTDIAMLSSIKASMQVVSGISAESIGKTLDSDVSQVVKRIPGVTVIQDRFIVVRGLNERYNTTLLQNVNVPSMEPDVRSFSFDVIPSNIIDQVLIFKSPAPELPGDFSGGTVKILTKGIPDNNSTILDVSTAYRQGSSMRTFLAEERRKGYWTGFNDGANDLPADFPERLSGLTNEQIQQAGLSLPNNWKEQAYNSGLDYKVNITNNLKKKFERSGIILGNITSIQYSNSKTIFDVINRSYEAFDFTTNEPKLRFDFNDVEYGQEIMTGIIHNWALKLNDNHFFEFKNLFNRLTTYDFVERFGDQVAQGFTQNNFAFFNEYRGLYSGQLIGNHKLFDESLRIEWITGYGNSFNQLPDYRRYRRNVVDAETGESVLFVPRGQTPDFLGKFYSEMNENIYSFALNAEQKLFENSSNRFKPRLKFGTYIENRLRNFDARNLGFSRSPLFSDDLTRIDIDELFSPENINSLNGIRIGENFSTSNFFIASNQLRAYYISTFLPIWKFDVMGGLRVEDNIQSLRSPDRFVDGSNTPPIDPVVIDQVNILPSFTVAFNATEKMKIKAVYGKTINRPEFREIAPFGFYDFIFDATVSGFSELRNAEIQNYDLRWEYYPSSSETISLAFFQKNFKNPIESLYGNFGSEQTTFLFRNTESAYTRGIEVDIRKSFANLFPGSFLSDFSVLANVSFIDSQVTLGEELATLLRAKDRPLQGQSNYIVNTGLFYDNLDRRLQVNLLYNVIGKRILLVGAGAIPDTYEMPRNILDISVRKGITPRLSAKFGIKDLFNQEFLLLQDGNEDGIFDRQSDQIFRRFKPGTSYSLGITYTLL